MLIPPNSPLALYSLSANPKQLLSASLDGAPASSPRVELEAQTRLTLSDRVSAQGLVAVGQADGELTLWRWSDTASLAQVARLWRADEISDWRAISISDDARMVAAVHEDQQLCWFDLERGHRYTTRVEGHIAAMSMSPDGQYVAVAVHRAKGGYIRLWRMDARGEPQLYMRALDRRALPHWLRPLARGHLSLRFDAARLYIYESARPAQDEGWDGFRGVVWAVDLDSARTCFISALDGALTGDYRPLHALYPDDPHGARGALWLDAATQQLWCGTGAGAIIGLDPRDGALLEVRHTGTTGAIVGLGQAPDAQLWGLSELGKILRTQ